MDKETEELKDMMLAILGGAIGGILALCSWLLANFIGLVLLAGCQQPVMELEPHIYNITTCEELLAIGDDPAGIYYLMNDIDCSGSVIPVQLFPQVPFTGIFYGQNHTIGLNPIMR